MAALRSLLYMLVFYAGSALYVLVAPLFGAMGQKAMIRHTYRWARFHDWCTRALLGIRMEVEGTLPSGPAIIAVKHEAMYETLQMLLLLKAPVPVFKQELSRIPLWGMAARRYGVIVVDRAGGAATMRQMLAEAKAALANGRQVLIFPEGTRTPHGTRPELKPGLAGLYRMLGVPIVPVACDSGRLLPRDSWVKRAGLVHFKVGQPIPPGLPREEVEARVHEAINALNPPLQGEGDRP